MSNIRTYKDKDNLTQQNIKTNTYNTHLIPTGASSTHTLEQVLENPLWTNSLTAKLDVLDYVKKKPMDDRWENV